MELNPIKQLNPATIGATVAVFTVTYIVMRKVFFKPVIEVMERRHARTLAAEDKYSEADGIVRSAEEECERIREVANEGVSALVEKSRARIDEVRETRLATARAEAETMLEEGRAAIREEADLERARLRSEAVECVSLSCEKLFGRADCAVVESNVDRVIAKAIH
jgi:F-type H+-transporting ATPase subunit b